MRFSLCCLPRPLLPPLPCSWQRALCFVVLSGVSSLPCASSRAGTTRINQEGRILGPAPTVVAPVLFNTPQADAVVAAMQTMPTDSAWNEDVSRLPLLANSAAMIAQIASDLGASRQTLRAFYEMNYALVPDNQPDMTITFFNYPDESDPSPYPIPANLPVEGWPQTTGGLTLDQWQRNVNGDDGDRHAIIVAPRAGTIWETWLTQLTGTGWQASNGARFDLNTNALRPAGWTSGDAAGLPMFPALVRYDECERGMVEHAMRLVVKRTRVGPIYPATHQASVGNTTDPGIPAMGQRVRLKADFVIPSSWTIEEKAVLLALKKYGAIVADNGGFFSISVCPDDRFADGAFDHLSTVDISNFEVVQSTGATGGPRSPGAPTADAGSDLTAQSNVPVALHGSVDAPAGASLSIEWKLYSGPGSVVFTNPAQPDTTATFTTPGTYTLMLSASDGVHAVAYSAVNVIVGATGMHPAFFTGETALSNGVYYLAFANGSYFGYYSFLTDSHYIYHFDLGYEYVFDAADGHGGVYFYDFKSSTFFYTSPSFPFPYLYDFTLNAVLYYYPDPSNPGHYDTNGVRYFYDFATGGIIMK